MAEKLPDGAFYPRKLAYSRFTTRDQRENQAGLLLYYLDGMVTRTLLETVFLMNDEWATEQHATAFSIKKHDDFLIETHGNCRKYAILHDSQSLDQKIGGYFDRRTISSGLKRSSA